jgi:hypothetical protein
VSAGRTFPVLKSRHYLSNNYGAGFPLKKTRHDFFLIPEMFILEKVILLDGEFL